MIATGFAVWLALCFQAMAQSSGVDYFPIASGNQWAYFQSLFPPPDFVPDTLFNRQSPVSEPLLINDTLYHVVDLPYFLADTLRADGQGRIWAKRSERQALLFDFTLEDGATYTWDDAWSEDSDYIVTVTRDLTFDTHLGRLDGCIGFSFDIPEAIDDERFFAFAPDIGPIRIIGSLGDYWEIWEAKLTSTTVTAIEESARLMRSGIEVMAYPNPFDQHTTIQLTLSTSAQTTVDIYDSLGRRVAVLFDRAIEGGITELLWDARAHPPGVYYARIHSGEELQTHVLTRQR